MTNNPLAAFAAAKPVTGATMADLHDWCEESNRWAEQFSIDRWHYVTRNKDTGLHEVRALDGDQAMAVRKTSTGWKPEYHGWTRERLDNETRLLRWFHRQGQRLEFAR